METKFNTPTITAAQGVTFDNGGQSWTQNTFFACDVVFPTTFAHDCMLWEMGGTPGSAGAYVGVRDVSSGAPKLRVRGGNNVVPPDANVVYVDVPAPADGKLHEVCWDFSPNAISGLSRVRVWIDGILKGTAQGDFYVSGTTVMWSGEYPGNMGGSPSGGGTVAGESTNAWPNVISRSMRVYTNQLGPPNEAEGRLGVPTAEYPAGKFAVATNEISSFYSMDAVIPSSFSESHVLFEIGGAGYGMYAGVVRSGTTNVFRVRGGAGGYTITYPGSAALPNMVYIQTEDFPQDGQWHNVAFDVRKNVNTTCLRLWIDGRLLGEQVIGVALPYLNGSDSGGFGEVNATIPYGESSNPWPAALGTVRFFIGESGAMPTNGPISFADIASEYLVSPVVGIDIADLYKTQPSLTTGIWNRRPGVYGSGAPEVPAAGQISFADFRGQRSRPPKSQRIAVTVPPAMTDFVLDQRTTLLTRSFANVTEAALTAEGWTFDNANLITFNATNIQPPVAVFVYSPIIKSVDEGVSHVTLTVSGASLEGDEVYRVYVQSVTSGAMQLVGSVPLTTSAVTHTVSLSGVIDLGVVDSYSSDGIRVVLNAWVGPSDIGYLHDVTIQKSETYVCAASTNRASTLNVYNIFNSLGSSWNSNDGVYTIVATDNTATRLSNWSRTLNGFSDGLNGEYIALRLPWPIYVSTITVRGLCVDFLVYGSVDGTTFDLLHTVTGLSGSSSTTHTVNIPASDNSYSILATKITRMMPGGWNRGVMYRMYYTGTKG